MSMPNVLILSIAAIVPSLLIRIDLFLSQSRFLKTPLSELGKCPSLRVLFGVHVIC